MAQAVASMAGLRGASQGVLEGSRQMSGAGRINGGRAAAPSRQMVAAVRASAEGETSAAQTSRRAALGLVAAGLAGGSFAKAVLAEDPARSIKIGPPPPPSGGLAGTLNSDQARDTKLPLKERFYLQPLPPAEAAARAKESAKEILNVKELIDKKAWPYVQNDLRLRASYLRYDLNTVIASKPKEEKKALSALTGNLFSKIDNLDYAAKIKSSEKAEKYYAETKSALDDVLAKLG
ncbi:oxygen-evolving enhancer protein 3-1, chloroplastic-like [Wolffia australiana]